MDLIFRQTFVACLQPSESGSDYLLRLMAFPISYGIIRPPTIAMSKSRKTQGAIAVSQCAKRRQQFAKDNSSPSLGASRLLHCLADIAAADTATPESRPRAASELFRTARLSGARHVSVQPDRSRTRRHCRRLWSLIFDASKMQAPPLLGFSQLLSHRIKGISGSRSEQ